MLDEDNATPGQLRGFGLTLGVLVAILFGILPLVLHRRAPAWPWAVAAVLWLGALVQPESLRMIHRGWTVLGLALGWLNTRILLTLVYTIFVVPLGLMLRLFGRDRVGKKSDPTCTSYRVPSKARSAKSLERPY